MLSTSPTARPIITSGNCVGARRTCMGARIIMTVDDWPAMMISVPMHVCSVHVQESFDYHYKIRISKIISLVCLHRWETKTISKLRLDIVFCFLDAKLIAWKTTFSPSRLPLVQEKWIFKALYFFVKSPFTQVHSFLMVWRVSPQKKLVWKALPYLEWFGLK